MHHYKGDKKSVLKSTWAAAFSEGMVWGEFRSIEAASSQVSPRDAGLEHAVWRCASSQMETSHLISEVTSYTSVLAFYHCTMHCYQHGRGSGSRPVTAGTSAQGLSPGETPLA